jgi:predicted nucleic acid-binding protein
MLVLDTDIMIDVLRGYPDTMAWLATNLDEELVLPAPVVMELIKGCVGRKGVTELRTFLKPLQIYCPTDRDFAAAIHILEQVHPSHNTGPFDALIAQCAITLNAPIVTFNMKHFRGIPGLPGLVQPYQKKKGFLQKILDM